MSLCAICGGNVEKKYTVFTADLGFGLLIVRNVPVNVCTQCGEEWVPADVAKKLESIADEARVKRPELEIVKFEEAA